MCSCALMCECNLTCPGTSSRCFGNRGQSSLTQLKAVHRKMFMKESQGAEEHTLGLMDRSHGTEWSEHRRKERAVYRTGKLWSSKRWLTPQKDSGAIRRHLHWGISVWSLVWEESSVWARISGIQMVLLLALVHSCQLRWPPCMAVGCMMTLTWTVT